MSNVLVVEASTPIASTLKKYLEGAGYGVFLASTLEAASALLSKESFSCVFAGVSPALDGTRLAATVRALPRVPKLALLFPPNVDDPEEAARPATADAYLVGPLKRGTVVSTARLFERLSAAEEKPPAELGAPASSDTELSFLKRLLLLEVKRARRYRYPMSFLLMAVDGEPGAGPSPTLLLDASSKTLRNIDLAVPSSGERVLVFLPHTGEAGARRAAQRLRAATAAAAPGVTASIGVSAYEPNEKREAVSFGSLVEAAGRALREAQAVGGDCVHVSKRLGAADPSLEA